MPQSPLTSSAGVPGVVVAELRLQLVASELLVGEQGERVQKEPDQSVPVAPPKGATGDS